MEGKGNREFQRGMEINDRRLAREHERSELRKKEREQRKINKRRAFSGFTANNENKNINKQLNNEEKEKDLVFELEEIAQTCLKNDDESIHLECCNNICELINNSKHVPIDEIIKCGIVPRLIEFLMNDNNIKLQFKSAYILTTISSGGPDHTLFLMEKHDGIIRQFINLLLSKNKNVCQQVVLALGNIVSDSIKYVDFILLNDGLKNLKILENKCIKSNNVSLIDIEILRNISWTICNLCRVKPQADFKYIIDIIECLTTMLTCDKCDDDEILLNIVWGFNYLIASDSSQLRIRIIIKLMNQYGTLKRLVDCLGHSKCNVKRGALRTLGHYIVGSNNSETQDVINMGVCDKLLYILNFDGKNDSLLKEACWVISNITAGTPSQIDKVISSNIFLKLIILLENESNVAFEIRQEAAWAICNAISVGNRIQIEYLVHRGIVTSLVSLLKSNDFNCEKLSLIAMEGLNNILECGSNIQRETASDENEFKNAFGTAHSLDKV